MLREIKSSQRRVRKLFFKVTGTGTAAINQGGTDAVLTDNGTGSYKLLFNTPGQRLLSCSVTPISDAGDVVATVHSDTGPTKLEIRTFEASDGTTAKDAVFYAEAVLSDDAAEV